MGVDGLERLIGPPQAQIDTIQRTVSVWQRKLGAESSELSAERLGWGRGKFTAWVAATRAKPGEAIIVTEKETVGFLASQPIAVLPLDADTHKRLWRLGIKTLSDLVKLPQVAVVSQFGRPGHDLWSLAAGAVVDPVVGKSTPEPIIAKVDFPNPVADSAMLSHSLDWLIERALRHPRRTGWRILKAH